MRRRPITIHRYQVDRRPRGVLVTLRANDPLKPANNQLGLGFENCIQIFGHESIPHSNNIRIRVEIWKLEGLKEIEFLKKKSDFFPI